MTTRSRGRSQIVILGGGSGGLELACQLAKRRDLDVVLVDRVGSHLWKPRLHEFAAGTISSSLSEISFYILGQLRGFRFEQGDVISIDHDARHVSLAPIAAADGTVIARERQISYDYCVVALGGVTADFGTAGVREHAIRLDAKVDADRFRERFIAAMIEARESGTPAEIVIVGSGATGTELAAYLRNSERAFFEGNEPWRREKLLGITILEAAPMVMPGGDDELRRQLLRRLKALDIKVVTDAKITTVEPDTIRTATGESWKADLTVWAAGLKGVPVLARLGRFELDEKSRIRVDGTLRSTADEHVFVLGDAASFVPKGAERPLPPTAQAASQQARYLADTLPLIVKDEPVEPFVYHNRGTLISLAQAGAVGKLGGSRSEDILIQGQFAIVAYHGLERQHQWRVLGPVRGTLAVASDIMSPIKGPPLKLHGG